MYEKVEEILAHFSQARLLLYMYYAPWTFQIFTDSCFRNLFFFSRVARGAFSRARAPGHDSRFVKKKHKAPQRISGQLVSS
jgi:hypothetical protein